MLNDCLYQLANLASLGQFIDLSVLLDIFEGRLGVHFGEQVSHLKVKPLPLLIQLLQMVYVEGCGGGLDFARSDLQNLVSLLVITDVSLLGCVFVLVLDSSSQHGSQKYSLIIGQLGSRQVDRQQGFGNRDRQADKHEFFPLQIGVRDVDVNQGGVPCDYRRYFDGEFIRCRAEVVVGEDEVANVDIAVEGVDDVATALEVDPAVGHVEVAE